IVLDPVMVATSGDRLLKPDAVEAMRTKLMPLAAVVTPNLPEAAALLDAPEATSEDEMIRQAERLLALGARAVLIKGGHSKAAESADLLVTPTATVRFVAARIGTKNTHGTGCTLAAAIAAGLAKGQDLAAAVRTAKDYVTAAIAAADRLAVGHGHGPVHHFHKWW
ncbi:MAG TPA: PfkB family carbohydrate kinase, partial [Thermoanaerobaculia bacterium]|nr:PfkB family carbohydrate kinase [Thermoanaerobaculia bacterium]